MMGVSKLKKLTKRINTGIGRCATRISPRWNTQLRYFKIHKRFWDEKNPVTINEKILWLKHNLYNSDPVVKQCADKLRVRDYLIDLGYEELLVPLIAVYEDADAIDFDALPESFAMKLNVGCGCNVICADKSKLDYDAVRKKMKKGMKANYWLDCAELQYKNVKPYILVEQFIGSSDGTLPVDYKIYCMNGHAKYVLVCVDREIAGEAKFFFLNRNWNIIPCKAAQEFPDYDVVKPEQMEQMYELAETLSKPFPYVRMDFYIVDGRIYFSEFTFTPCGGHNTEPLETTDAMMGEQLVLTHK